MKLLERLDKEKVQIFKILFCRKEKYIMQKVVLNIIKKWYLI